MARLPNEELPGIDLNADEQLDVLNDFAALSKEEETFWSRARRNRFDIENDFFSYDDAPVLHYMLRKLKPRTVIEIGSGYSSAAMIDTDDLYLGKSIKFHFIDPHPERLDSVLLASESERVKIWRQEVQEVPLSLFDKLEKDDLLFIDSSHVVKAGSDLHYILFQIMPRLKSGVWVHLHDVRFPFEYPKENFDNKIYWNEAYVLRAFLMFNQAFKIGFWMNYLVNRDAQTKDLMVSTFPLEEAARRFGVDVRQSGGSIYLRRL